MNNKIKLLQSKMFLRQLELNLHLGWTESERAKKQAVFVDIMICFSHPPKACFTDQLENTYCYDKLIEKITQTTLKQSFCLIEHLAYTIYELTHIFLNKKEKIQVTITKKPLLSTELPIANVSFSYGDIT